MKYITVAFVSACLLQAASAAFGPKRLYSMDVDTTPVSVKVIGRDLLIVGPWYIGSIINVNWKFRQPSKMIPRIVNKDIASPQAVGKIPPNAFSGSKALQYWVATHGANETSGAMYVLRPTATYSVWKDITIDAGWNYERAQWVDMNRDGRIDCLTARYRGGVGQLLWFQQPAGQQKWGQQIIHEGMADGNFVGFAKGGKTYILVAGLEFSTLGLYWTMSKTNLWSSSRMVRHRVVDNYGKYYDVQYVDLNRDGRPDVLTTTVNIGNSRGHVLGYEVPNDIQNKIWKRRVLAAGFKGDLSPGKATAFWPNRRKRKTDRPSILLSGAGQEMLFILTPRPARSGWSYIKTTVRAGKGMIGLPYIGDIDGDSYPEVLVPQGKKLYVFSYDYNAAVAKPPSSPVGPGKVTPKPVIRYMPPFFEPDPPASSRNTSRSGIPRSGGLTGDSASQFGASGVLPSADSSRTVAPLANLPPLRTRGGGSSSSGGNSRPASSNLPANLPRRNPIYSSGGSDSSSGGTSGGAGSTGGSGTSGTGGLGLWPLVTSNGAANIPVPNQQSPPEGNSPRRNTPQTGGNSPARQPWSPGSSSSGGSPRVSPGSGRTTSSSGGASDGPVGGGSRSSAGVSNGGVVPLQGDDGLPSPQSGSNQDIVPLDESNTGGDRITSNNAFPFGGVDNNGFTPSRSPMEPIFEDETEPPVNDYYWNYGEDEGYDEYYDQNSPSIDPPLNLLLSTTSQSYRYREEAADACSFENKVLCSLMQLEAARSIGPIPLIEWGWYDTEGRAAAIHDCVPGEVQWTGYKCHNGIVGHAPVQQATTLKGYCCSILREAIVTDQKFSNYHQAEEGCNSLGHHICSLKEMYKVWEKSSYKSDAWGWFRSDQKLIKMVHSCDPNQAQWPGYECLSRKLTTHKISASYVQESAYCCHKSSGTVVKTQSFSLLFFFIFILHYCHLS